MSQDPAKLRFKANLLRPAKLGEQGSWAFLVLPKSVSEKLPRRGRTSVEGTINGHHFRATLEPDGQLSHWLKVSKVLRKASGVEVGDTVTLELVPVAKEPEPKLPPDFREALAAAPEAKAVWTATTVIARIDWIHWIESARQSKTRKSRVESACDMLASGKPRICCFDQSGFYSKSLSAPKAVGLSPRPADPTPFERARCPMYIASFIYSPGQYDEEFHRLNAIIDSLARSLPGFLGTESWTSADGGRRNATYYWNDLDTLKLFAAHPAHQEAKRQYARWYEGYHIVISELVRSYGDGSLTHITPNHRAR